MRPDRSRSLYDLSLVASNPAATLLGRARDEPGRVALITGGEAWTYRRLADASQTLASAMHSHGIRPGDRVALHMTNLPELAVAYFACFLAGAIAVPLNVRLRTAELQPLLEQVRAALYLGQAELYPQVAPIEPAVLAPAARFVIDASPKEGAASWASLLAKASSGTHVPHAPGRDDPALLLATSGTTGRSKLVIHTPATLSAIADSFTGLRLGGKDVVLIMLPMVHGAAFTILFACIHFGVPAVLLERFDPGAALDAIQEHRCSWTMGVPFMFAELLQQQRARPRKVGSLQLCLVVGDVCPEPLQQAFPSAFDGAPLRSLLGSSEAVWSLTYGLRSGPVSRVAPGTEVRVVNDAGDALPPGETGELLIRSASVSPGYWVGAGRIEGAPEEGWCRTGDLARLGAEEEVWFVAREKDLIVRGGSNISPVEIEQALLAHPAVHDAAVVGVPDAALGQRVGALVQLKQGNTGDHALAAIRADLATRLAEYKTPERLRAVDAIPRNAMGKVDRAAALELVRSGPAR